MTYLMDSSRISATGLAAHRTKMNLIAQNLANVDTTRTKEGGPYRRQMVIFSGKDIDDFETALDKAWKNENKEIATIEFDPIEFNKPPRESRGTGCDVAEIVKSQEDFRLVYNPAHPDADPNTGYVAMPNVDHLTEVADMIVAKRAYEASATALANTKSMTAKALEIGK
ncbi:FlgC [Desulfamplus magnetovallimortis]|uniref:Flagellar basal-body rod protein FlgC n=1 Tax=Desulfamplus magnetovallimortis TaxID=1246637 RepID=A0A1W1H9Z7_9BACT|nr:flagellar basal body rod protein FlgC [Desulfamplus magnetovallimortis]SLM29263.1 FlgC [Desulfamplus magnetovallimortis]